MSSPVSSRLERLPSTLLQDIIGKFVAQVMTEYEEHGASGRPGEANKDKHRDLRHLMLTSKTVSAVAKQVLYRVISIDTHVMLLKLLSTLLDQPENGEMVRVLECAVELEESAIPSSERLHYQSRQYGINLIEHLVDHSIVQKIRHKWETRQFSGLEKIFATILLLAPKVQHLSLMIPLPQDDGEWEGYDDDGFAKLLTLSNHRVPATIGASLQTLSLWHPLGECFHPSDLPPYLPFLKLPSLKTLELAGIDFPIGIAMGRRGKRLLGNLSHLDLRQCVPANLEYISALVKHCPKLRTLNLCDNPISQTARLGNEPRPLSFTPNGLMYRSGTSLTLAAPPPEAENWNKILSVVGKTLESLCFKEEVEHPRYFSLEQSFHYMFGEYRKLSCIPDFPKLTTLSIDLVHLFGVILPFGMPTPNDHDARKVRLTRWFSSLELPPNLSTINLHSAFHTDTIAVLAVRYMLSDEPERFPQLQMVVLQIFNGLGIDRATLRDKDLTPHHVAECRVAGGVIPIPPRGPSSSPEGVTGPNGDEMWRGIELTDDDMRNDLQRWREDSGDELE